MTEEHIQETGANNGETSTGEILTVEEAAKFLRLGINTLYEAVGRLEIPHRRIGRTIRFSRTGLVRWLSEPCKATSREG